MLRYYDYTKNFPPKKYTEMVKITWPHPPGHYVCDYAWLSGGWYSIGVTEYVLKDREAAHTVARVPYFIRTQRNDIFSNFNNYLQGGYMS